MNSALFFIIALTLLVSPLTVLAQVYCVNGVNLNVRPGPSTSGSPKWVARPGDSFVALSGVSNGWLSVRATSGSNCGQSGYVSAQYIRSCNGPSSCGSSTSGSSGTSGTSGGGQCSTYRNTNAELGVPCYSSRGPPNAGCCCNFYVAAKIGKRDANLGPTSQMPSTLPANGWCRCPSCMAGSVGVTNGHTGIVVNCNNGQMVLRGANQGCWRSSGGCSSDCGCDNINNWTRSRDGYSYYHPSCC